MDNLIICPGCGWTGLKENLGKWGDCPVCQYEYGDGPLPAISELMVDNISTYNDVRMDLFLASFTKLLTTYPQISRRFPADFHSPAKFRRKLVELVARFIGICGIIFLLARLANHLGEAGGLDKKLEPNF